MKQVKALGLVVTSLVGIGVSYAQAPRPAPASRPPTQVYYGANEKPRGHQPLSPDQVTTEMIRSIIRSGPLKIKVPRLKRMGDQAAVVATQMIAGQDLSENEQLAVVSIVREAFEMPPAIMHAKDRTPDATTSLLDSLDRSTVHQSVRLQISDTKQHIWTTLALAGFPVGGK
jgi:hypothetical protein